MKFTIFSLALICILITILIFYFICLIDLSNLVNTIILLATVWVIGMQSFATEKMAMYQVIPAIDVNMVYDNNKRKTYFWFSNESNLPGFVYLRYKKNEERKKKVYHSLRVPPKRRMKTATSFEFLPKDKDEMIIYVLIKPSIDKSSNKFEFKKSYKFNNNRWDETSWGYPDPPFLG